MRGKGHLTRKQREGTEPCEYLSDETSLGDGSLPRGFVERDVGPEASLEGGQEVIRVKPHMSRCQNLGGKV